MSIRIKLPFLVPVPPGVNATVMGQFAPGASELGQVVDRLKSPLKGPPVVIAAMLSVPVPVLVSVTV